MTTLITLVIPVGGDAGPFNLSSNVNGYTPPFETNIPALTLTAGYTTSLVPDGTTTIRVTSVGVCTNYIDIPVVLTPTTTTTSSSSSTSTSTTTAVPITTTTTSSSSTSTSTSTSTTTATPTTTTTTTTALITCLCYTLDYTPPIEGEPTGVTYYQYTDCDGLPQNIGIVDLDPPVDVCAQEGSIEKTTGDGNGAYEPSINNCCDPIVGQVTIQNNNVFGVGSSIDNVQVNLTDVIILIGSTPVYGEQTAKGTYGAAIPGLSTVEVYTSGITVAPVSLLLNGVFTDCLITSGYIQFLNVDLSANPNIKITLDQSGQSC